MRIAVIGAGAAGCFAAINARQMMPEAEIVVYEGGARALAKVAVTGGGRCNLTNSFASVKHLAAVYPRGERLLKRLFKVFGHEQAYRWFEQVGVRLMVQDDDRVFPKSERAQEVVDKLLEMMRNGGVGLKTSHKVKSVVKQDGGFRLDFVPDRIQPVEADCVVVACGGFRKEGMERLLADFGLEVAEPVPALFSLNIPDAGLNRLTGISVEDVRLSVCGTRLKSEGGLLITHHGISGPAVLKLSSHGARHLAECGYRTVVSINWMGDLHEQAVREVLDELAAHHRMKQVQSVCPGRFNARLWQYFLIKAGLNPAVRWCDCGKKDKNRLAVFLTDDTYQVTGKNPFKEEFVTCGGVALSNVNLSTLECRTCENLYFAGEVLDVDAVTGGFNLQAAWTTGYVAAKSIAEK